MLAPSRLKELTKLLKKGELIAFPTETVYALAGDARSLTAIQQLFKLKNRPLHQALSVLLAENSDLALWADSIPASARRLAHHFWPGPLTLILNKNESVLPELVGGGTKIGLRVPDHAIAQAILKAFGSGLAAPSANRTAQLSPTHAQHVHQEFSGQGIHVVDGAICSIGIESTIVDVTTTVPRIIRLGAISQEEIQKVIACEMLGALPTILGVRAQLQHVASNELKTLVAKYLHQGKTVTVLARHAAPLVHQNLLWLLMPQDVYDYSRVLYHQLRVVKQNASDKILVESLPQHAAWTGIRTILAKQAKSFL
jgi:L-threonylcarbamoyladenylate synthase